MVDSVRQIAVWMDTWNTKDYPRSTIPTPPFGVPVPVKTGSTPPPQQQNRPTPTPAATPSPVSAMTDLDIFKSE